jgi:hypothetical protein
MKFENVSQSKFLGRWQYSVQLVHQIKSNQNGERWGSKQEWLAVSTLESFLKFRAVGPWERQGTIVYVDTLDDAFNLRLYFDSDIKIIQKALNP